MSLSSVERQQANPDTAAPIKSPHIIPTVNAYLETLPVSFAMENRPDTNSGEIVDISKANSPPKREESSEPSRMTRKKPIAVLITVLFYSQIHGLQSYFQPTHI